MLLITHDLRLAAHVCDDIAVLYAGEQVEYGPAARGAAPLAPSLHLRRWTTPRPTSHGPQRLLPALGGQMPGVSALARYPGCRFAARCPTRNAACDGSSRRRCVEAAPGHWVRCIAPRELPQRRCREPASAHDDAAGATARRPRAPPLVELQDATLRYTARRGLLGLRKVHNVAVDRLSLKVQPGEFVGIVGESGSGKSSVARLIVGAESLTSGRC